MSTSSNSTSTLHSSTDSLANYGKQASSPQGSPNSVFYAPSSPSSPSMSPPSPPRASASGSAPVVLRQRFLWRHYPSLTSYLSSRRSEYDLHSAQNYTSLQRAFNNSLTDGLVAHAAGLGMTFEGSFTRPMIRDRIRCFYKAERKREEGERGQAK